jgi:hypothetical protein
MNYPMEKDPSNPGRFQVRFVLPDGREILFTQLKEEFPSQKEFDVSVERYQEAASERSKENPLIVDVVAEGLRSK